MTDSAMYQNHVTDSEMALYIDHRLSSKQRDRIEDHLAHCAECREHLLATHSILSRVRRQPRIFAIGGVLAAAAVAVIVIGKIASIGETGTPQFRTAVSSNAGLTAYGPTGDATRANLRFVWGGAPRAVSYRLSVTTADGGQLWSASGTDTVAIIPPSIRLQTGQTYFWVVDAVLVGGATRSTGLKEFVLVR